MIYANNLEVSNLRKLKKRKHLFSSLRKKQDGQSMVEFALVLPLLLLLVLGIIQFGFIFNGMVTVTSAAREGARFGVVKENLVSNDSDVRERVISSLAGALFVNVDENTIIVAPDSPEAGKLSVTVTGSVPVVVPVLNIITGSDFSFTSTSIMRIE